MTRKNHIITLLLLCISISGAALLSGLLNLSFFLPFIIAFALIATLLIFQKPFAFLSTLFFIRTITDYTSQNVSIDVFTISISLSQMIGLGIAALGAPFIIKHRASLSTFQLITPFALLFSWGIASLLFSIDIAKTLQDLIRVFDLFVIGFIAFISIKKQEDFQTFLLIVLFSSIVPIFAGFIQSILGIGLQDDNVSIARIYGTFAHPNVYSLYLFSVIACATLFLLSTKNTVTQKIRLLFGSFILMASFTVLILTFARVAWVVVFFFLTILALWRYPAILFPLIFIPVIIFTISGTFQERVLQTFSHSSNSSVSWRTEIWQDMTQRTLSENRQWYGYGLEAFPRATEQLRGNKLGSNDAHNDYVKFFVEGGFIGLAVYLAYISLIFRSMFIAYRSSSNAHTKLIFGILMIFFASMMLAALTDNIFKNTPLWWVFFSLLGGALALFAKESAQKSTIS